MAKLQELIKGFRANVREGYPCELRFDGETLSLYPTTSQDDPRFRKTFIGLSRQPSTHK